MMRPFGHKPETAPDRLAERAEYGDVVALVRSLGADAVDEFLADVAPSLHAIQTGDESAVKPLQHLLHEWAVTAVVVEDSGGIVALDALSKEAAKAEPKSLQETLDSLNDLSA